MTLLAILSLALCFYFGYLALSRLSAAYKLRYVRLQRQRIRLSRRFWPFNVPISYL